MVDLTDHLIALHGQTEHDLERGIAFQAIVEASDFTLEEVQEGSANLHSQGLAYQDPDANAPGGVAQRVRVTDRFFEIYPQAAKKWPPR
ncbi:MAG: hypothetical protein K1X67_22145 [Fimbriimonadaceae bacterium]|nr:hypothetical protein [Fimbriimonadaceae bacterium]